MATYTELYDLMNDTGLRNRVATACLVSAEAIRTEAANVTNHANRLLWAKAAFNGPTAEATRMLPAILATNKAQTVAQITGATDAALQTAVNAAVDIFATGS